MIASTRPILWPALLVSGLLLISYCDATQSSRSVLSSAIARPRSLMQLLTGSSGTGNAASSLGSPAAAAESAPAAATTDKASGLLDLAQALVGKGEGNSSLYVKLFKLLLNLFMDVMMDRIARREDTDHISFIPHQRLLNEVKQRNPFLL